MTTALIVVDVQNDFTHPDGSLFVKGAESAIEEINRVTADYEHVVYTRDWHPAKTKHFADYGGPWPAHCVAGTWGAEYHRDLVRRLGVPQVFKGVHEDEDGYSGFVVEHNGHWTPTDLDDTLQEREVDQVHVVGVALDVCVKATALDAVGLDYKTVVVTKATAAVTPEGATGALEELEAAGVYLL